uniref:Serine palmitoyltransferase 3 n=1 Tax=Culex pipiens TaxID=7175 RepID=A0A8D8FSZ4_CULPI
MSKLKENGHTLQNGTTKTVTTNGHHHHANGVRSRVVLGGEKKANGTKISNGFSNHRMSSSPVSSPPVQKYDHSQEAQKSSYEQVPLHTACFTYLGFYLLMILGYINQLFFTPKVATEKHRDGYVPLYDAFEKFYMRYVYRRVKDCWNRPICSVPGAEVTLKERITKDYGWSFECVLFLLLPLFLSVYLSSSNCCCSLALICLNMLAQLLSITK